MKTKKALAGLLGLLGSFAAFLLFFPALVAPVLFTESLQTRTKHKPKIITKNSRHDIFRSETWENTIKRLNHEANRENKKIKHEAENNKNQNLLGVGFPRARFSSFHVETCRTRFRKKKIYQPRIAWKTDRKAKNCIENWSEATRRTFGERARVRVWNCVRRQRESGGSEWYGAWRDSERLEREREILLRFWGNWNSIAHEMKIHFRGLGGISIYATSSIRAFCLYWSIRAN